ncbi:putative ankyrin repeat protein [Feldmannia species virus]|uniref:Putative ankyrin repeat protein n=1 Tax=Feldmannia species virus TaxID=39420 RepID=B5LWN2_9PHYC|nr:putative ankyrin repeat protein [Feldmannia species virus]ACH46895.1 putative ankyrin repeat protein [Feldmannia species virus]
MYLRYRLPYLQDVFRHAEGGRMDLVYMHYESFIPQGDPLGVALRYGNLSIATQLLEDKFVLRSKHLHDAVYSGKPMVVRWVRENGLTFEKDHSPGVSWLMYCARASNVGVAREVALDDHDINRRDAFATTALGYSLMRPDTHYNLGMTRFLISHGADETMRNSVFNYGGSAACYMSNVLRTREAVYLVHELEFKRSRLKKEVKTPCVVS